MSMALSQNAYKNFWLFTEANQKGRAALTEPSTTRID